MRPYREMPRFLLVREQLSLGWKTDRDLRIAGAAFYVSVEQAEFCRGILREAGFKAGLID